jgi:hypothetical protein
VRSLVTDIKHDRHGLIIVASVKWRQEQREVRLTVPWRWLAHDDIMERLQTERDRQHRPIEDRQRPWLPLESWE